MSGEKIKQGTVQKCVHKCATFCFKKGDKVTYTYMCASSYKQSKYLDDFYLIEPMGPGQAENRAGRQTFDRILLFIFSDT